MADQPTPAPREEPPRVRFRFQPPPGLLPRYAQHVGLAGLALVMVAIMWVTSPPAAGPKSTPRPALPTTDAQHTRIQEYQRRLQEEADRLAREQANLALAKQALGDAAAPRFDSRAPPPAPSGTTGDTLAQERARREERARFADNVAFRRAPPSAPASPTSTTSSPVTPTAAGQATSAPAPPGQHRLSEGTTVDTVLTNRVDGGTTGPVNCLVRTPVYARYGETLLIPAGARFLGTVQPVQQLTQGRVDVAFHRLIFPNGGDVPLPHLPGLDQAGDRALRGDVHRHTWQAVGASIAVSALGALAAVPTQYGFGASGVDLYRQGFAAGVSDAGRRTFDRFLNQPPTVVVPEGHPVVVYLTADLDLPPYRETAEMPMTATSPKGQP